LWLASSLAIAAEDPTLGRKQDYGAGAFTEELPELGFHCLENRLWLHDHPPAAAVWDIVSGVVLIVCEIADVVNVHREQVSLSCSQKDAALEIRREDLREKRKDLEDHRVILA
jgi:hypothetical protein